MRKTGWDPPPLMQDDNPQLSQWFASRPDARYVFIRNQRREKMTKPKLGRPRAPNGQSAVQTRVQVGLNLAAAEKLKALQDHFNTKLGFALTTSQVIEYLYRLHANDIGETK